MAVAHKSAISVGLLYIPVGLYKTTRDTSISYTVDHEYRASFLAP